MTEKKTNRSLKKKSTPGKKEELSVCGWNSCSRLFENRPQDILRVYFSEERSPSLGKLKKWCASRKLPYRQLDETSLAKAAASTHHEGLVIVARPKPELSWISKIKKGLSGKDFFIALDRIGNSHNCGAIIRSAAFFGVKGILISREKGQAPVSSSMVRTAEGALEFAPLYNCTNLSSALREFKSAGGFVIGADAKAEKKYHSEIFRFPCILVLGNEQEGLSPAVKRRCDTIVRIPGSGDLESLNVSVAAGILLAETFKNLKSNS